MTRKVWCLTGLLQSPAHSGFPSVLFWFYFAFFFFKENETLYNKVDKFFFEIVTLTVNTVTFLEVWDLTLL